jgi:cell wall-associated NlpC family hydrolase
VKKATCAGRNVGPDRPMYSMRETSLSSRRGAARAVLAVLAISCGLLIAQTSAAPASPIADKKRQAAEISQQIHEFDARLETTIERYNQAAAHMKALRQQIVENRVQLSVTRANLKVAQANLAEVLVSSYKDGDSSDPAAILLSASSFSDLVGRVEFLQRAEAAHAELLAQISSAEREIASRQAKLKTDEAETQKLVARRAAEKQSVLAQLADRRTLLASVNSDIKRLIAESERRQEQAAAAAAAAAASASASSSGNSSGGGYSGGGAPPSNGSLGQQAVQIAMQYLGMPYVWGGASPSGFDCSGLTMYVYAQLGISLPHYTGDQWNAGPHVSRDQLQPGDLVFFTASLGHMGMYVGGGSFIHAPHTGDVVKISSLSDSWYSSEYQGAVRVVG